ncbi:hypothetical protein PISMIDRAFT_690466 [Pisolithus microcarpus 441]|uniref:Uncharacterized protein n=1 Tax=Pisolithus microcarpus 441 TaxID=765257 RepID=A0A0C9Y293_9AGAM|nr:hypothetical protein PISMIDRAFT_690466 [Pisolithus microcarpus 441]
MHCDEIKDEMSTSACETLSSSSDAEQQVDISVTLVRGVQRKKPVHDARELARILRVRSCGKMLPLGQATEEDRSRAVATPSRERDCSADPRRSHQT